MARKQKNPVHTAMPNLCERITSDPPTKNEIRARAYEIYLARGDAPGDAVSDWLEAERELYNGRGKPHQSA